MNMKVNLFSLDKKLIYGFENLGEFWIGRKVKTNIKNNFNIILNRWTFYISPALILFTEINLLLEET